MPTLSQYTNVFDTALALLHAKGYQVWRDDVAQLFYAERDGWDFAADDPVGLLGVIGIFEAVQPAEYREYWWTKESARGLQRRLATRPERPYTPVCALNHDGSRDARAGFARTSDPVISIVTMSAGLRGSPGWYLSSECVLALGAFLHGYMNTNVAMKGVLDRIEAKFPGASTADVCTRAYLAYATTQEALVAVMAEIVEVVERDPPAPVLGWDGADGFIAIVRDAIARDRPGMALGESTVMWLRDGIAGSIEGMRAVDPARADEQAGRLAEFERWLGRHLYRTSVAPWHARIRVAHGPGAEGVAAFIKWWDQFEAEQRERPARTE